MQDEAFMDKAFWWVAAVVVVVIAAGSYYYFHKRAGAAPPTVQQITPVPAPSTEPAIRHPIPDAGMGPAAAQPPLAESDGPVRDALAGIVGGKTIGEFLTPQNIVRHIVVTVDNLPRKKVAVELRPIKPTGGKTAISGTEDALTLSPDNYARYAPFVQLVRSTDAKQLTRVYFSFYPLFQESYENLGYPSQYFNDRLVEVIDDLLKAPDVSGQIELVQPRVFYEFKDRNLEARSAGQKLLIRMGSANAAVIKEKLREIRAEVVAHEKARSKP